MLEISEVEPKPDYALYSIIGEVDLEGLTQVLEEVHADCQVRQLRGAFVDLTATSGTLDGMERFEIAFSLLEKWDKSVFLSLLIQPEQAAPGKIGQMVAQNRGFRVRVFTQRQPAIGWLEMALASR